VPDCTLLEVAQSADRLDLPLLKRSMTRHASGVLVLPRPVSLEDAARIEPEAIRRVLGLLKAAFSVVVVDASKALHPSDLAAFEVADVVLAVAQLEVTCLRNTGRLLQVLRQVDGVADKLRLAINREGSLDCPIKPAKAAEFLKLSATWTMPNATRECTLARARGVPLVVCAPKSALQKAVERMAAELLAGPTPVHRPDAPTLTRIAAMF
jgi:pilus assembly protein CpaE